LRGPASKKGEAGDKSFPRGEKQKKGKRIKNTKKN